MAYGQATWRPALRQPGSSTRAPSRSSRSRRPKKCQTGPILRRYGEAQTRDLEETINRSDVDLVIIGTPIDLTRIIKINKPSQRVRYELQEIGQPTLEDILKAKFGK
jgi:predicted GTPase